MNNITLRQQLPGIAGAWSAVAFESSLWQTAFTQGSRRARFVVWSEAHVFPPESQAITNHGLRGLTLAQSAKPGRPAPCRREQAAGNGGLE